jgi:hypothetical protein
MDSARSALLLKLIRSEIELARVFLLSSRAAYRLGNHQDGDTARQKAEAAYSRALQAAEEISEAQRQILVAELDQLKTCLSWLPLRNAEGGRRTQAKAFGRPLPLKGRRGRWMTARVAGIFHQRPRFQVLRTIREPAHPDHASQLRRRSGIRVISVRSDL